MDASTIQAKRVIRTFAVLCVLAVVAVTTTSAAASRQAERTFNGAGIATTPALGFGLFPLDLTEDRSKRLLAAVSDGADGGGFDITRFRSDGSLDRSFASDGHYRRSVGTFRAPVSEAVDTQRDGKVLVAGWQRTRSATGPLLIRLTRSGDLDKSFAQKGRLGGKQYNGIAYRGLAVQDDDKIVVVGSVGERAKEGRRPGLVIARYTKNGRLDRTFGRDGTVILRNSRNFAFTGLDDVKVLASGKTVAVGYRQGGVVAVGLDRKGRLDNGFGGGDGLFVKALKGSQGCEPGLCRPRASMAVDRRGRIVIQAESQGSKTKVVVVRLTKHGLLDRGFGRAGVAAFKRGAFSTASGVALAPGGQIVVAASSSKSFKPDSPNRFTIFVLTSKGSPSKTRIVQSQDQGAGTAALQLQNGQVLVAGGLFRPSKALELALVRQPVGGS